MLLAASQADRGIHVRGLLSKKEVEYEKSSVVYIDEP